jgi:protein-disulfide isomerase
MILRSPISEKDHVQGNPDAPITLVQYGDYQCPFCWKAYPIVKRLQVSLGDHLKFIFRNFPLTKVHPHAKIAALASEAAALQHKFWEMHDLLYERHKDLQYEAILSYASELGLDLDLFEKNIKNPELEEKVDADFLGGLRSGVNATPTFFINGEKYTESWEENNLLEHIWTSNLV